MNKMNDKLTEKTKARKIGGSIMVIIPPDHAGHCDININDGATLDLRIQTENTEKHGNYLTLWNPKQQEKEK